MKKENKKFKYYDVSDSTDIKRGLSPLNGLKSGSIAVIISVALFSLMMWGVIEFFSAIGDLFDTSK